MTPVRRDLVDVRLAGRYFAPHYAAATPHWATRHAPILTEPGAASEVRSELHPGEAFEVLELSGDHAWGRCCVDGVVGYIASDALSLDRPSRPVPNANLRATDPASAAETLLGTPARAGGRSPQGVDASGLIFLALQMAGIAAPRFCDLQAQQVGTALTEQDALRRGDLVFFDDHAAILTDGENAIHVPAGGMVERIPLDALAGPQGFGPILARRRPA